MRRLAVPCLVLALISPAFAQSPPVVPYPSDYKTTLVKYAVVDRIDGTSRALYASRDAIEALRRDPRLTEFPAGVLFAIDVKDERTLHLMQKVLPGFGSQNWAFGGFDPVTTEPLKLQLPGDCHLCHQAALMSDMTYSMTLLRRFASSGVVQRSFCRQPGRQSCPF